VAAVVTVHKQDRQMQ